MCAMQCLLRSGSSVGGRAQPQPTHRGQFFESRVRTKLVTSSCHSNMDFSITDLGTSLCYSRGKFMTFKAHFFSIQKIQTDLVLFSYFQCHEHVKNFVRALKNLPQLSSAQLPHKTEVDFSKLVLRS